MPLLIGLLLLAGAGQRTALAHALLTRSEPAANAELTSSPSSVEMWFSEPLEERFSHARLIDARGDEVLSAGPSVVDASDPTHLSLPLAQLTPGIYTVIWTTLSSVDGHEWVGSFPLTLLNPDGSRPASGNVAVVTGETGEIPSSLKGVARWLSLLGSILLVGSLLFRELIARPALARQSLPGLAASLARGGQGLGFVGVAGVLLGGWLQIGAQVAALGAMERLFDLLVSTQPGRLLLVRQLLLLPIVAVLVMENKPARMGHQRTLAGWVRVAGEYLVGVVLLLTFSLASHAAVVPGRGWAVIGDFIHLLAAAAWMGGLLLLAFLFWQSRAGLDDPARRAVGQIVRRFSLLAAGAVFVLTVTGLFSSVVQLSSVADLWNTTYGLLLLGKLALVALALGLAFLNNRTVRRPGAGTDLSQKLVRRVGIEALVSLGLLLVIALLVQTPPPPRPQPPVTPALPFINIAQAGDLLVHLQISPNQPGSNRFWTHLYHPDGSAIGDVQLVRLFFAPKQAELGQARADLPSEGNDIYVDEGAWMSQAGEWDVTVYVRRRGMDDATAEFAVTIPPAPGVLAQGTPWQNPAATLPLSALGGGLLLALGLTPFLWWKPVRRRNRDAASMLGGVGLACLIIGLMLTVQGVATSDEGQAAAAPGIARQVDSAATPGAPGPIALPTPTPTPDDIFLAGAEIFQANCVQCHGPHGMGDGPVATTLPIQPAILPFHVPLHPDEDVYVFVSEGFPNLGMPAFKEMLSQEELLQVVRYLRVRFGRASP